jgi:hypothetical protein
VQSDTATRRLRSWVGRRRQLKAACGPVPTDWIVDDVEATLDELDATLARLEQYEDANRGMVLGIDDLDALPEEVAEC